MFRWLQSLFGSKDDGPPVTLESIQGRWRMVSVGRNGNFAPPQFFAEAKIFMIIQGDQYTIQSNGKEGDKGTIHLDVAQTPAHFDQHITAGKDKGTTMLGIVRFRDGMMENCQGETGHPRPKDFARKRNDNASLACFKKAGSR